MSSIFLTAKQITIINQHCLADTGEHHAITNRTGLESAAARPQHIFDGQLLHKSIAEQAAALAHAITINHPFEQGNKRTAYDAMQTFLTMNSCILAASRKETFEFIIAIADGKIKTDQAIQWGIDKCRVF